MRVGVNPAKLNYQLEKRYYHRIIIPVYVPNFEGYFEDIFEVYKVCILSAYKTQHDQSAITVVDNGSCQAVKDWLLDKQQDGVIETLITHIDNVGKVDAILGAARGCREDLVTVSDSDILFHDNWQEEVEKIFQAFDNVGCVAPFPIARHMYYYSSAVQAQVMRGKLKFSFEQSPNLKAIKSVYESYSWSFEDSYDGMLPTVEYGGQKAVMGGGHQVMTIHRDAIFSMPFEPSFIKISNESEKQWIDRPIEENSLLRLSTFDTMVTHMGNKISDQELSQFGSIQKNSQHWDYLPVKPIKLRKRNPYFDRLLCKLFKIRYDHRGAAPKMKKDLRQDGL